MGYGGRNPRVALQVLVEMYQANMTLREIGAAVGLCHTNVGTRLKRAGIARRPKRCRPVEQRLIEDMRLFKKTERYAREKLRIERRAEWAKLYTEDGLSLIAIGRMYQKDHTTVLRELRLAGIQRRPAPGGYRPRRAIPKPAEIHALSHDAMKQNRIKRMLELAARIERRKRGLAA